MIGQSRNGTILWVFAGPGRGGTLDQVPAAGGTGIFTFPFFVKDLSQPLLKLQYRVQPSNCFGFISIHSYCCLACVLGGRLAYTGVGIFTNGPPLPNQSAYLRGEQLRS